MPGAIVVSLYAAIVATYDASAPSPTSSALAAGVAALFAGLVLLLVDAPARATVYRSSPHLPDRELRTWPIDPSPYGGYLNLYFVLLDVSFPPTIRDRALYMGSLFRIGFEAIYFVGGGAIAVLLIAVVSPEAGAERIADEATVAKVLIAGSIGHAIAVLYAVRTRFAFRRGRMDARAAIQAVARELLGDLGAPAVASCMVAGVGLAGYIATRDFMPALLAVVVPAAVWAVIFFRGRSVDGHMTPVGPPAAVFLYGTAVATACAMAAVAADGSGTLDVASSVAWAGASLLPSVLMATRGHERKLIGSFQTQTTWMRLNRETLIRKHRLGTE